LVIFAPCRRGNHDHGEFPQFSDFLAALIYCLIMILLKNIILESKSIP
jgi:hypothetical protein